VRQWPKNMLVFAAPATVGALSDPDVLGRVSLMALAFCLLSSGAYLLNDLRDAPLLVSDGRGAAPEEVLFGDRFMQLASLAWLISLTPGVV
jgi:hypothetical protein